MITISKSSILVISSQDCIHCNIELQNCMNGPQQKLMVKSYSLSHQSFKWVSCRICNENTKTQRQGFESSKNAETSEEKAKHSLLAALQSLQASRSSLEVLGYVQNVQEFTGKGSPGQMLPQTASGTQLLTILTYLSPGKCLNVSFSYLLISFSLVL